MKEIGNQAWKIVIIGKLPLGDDENWTRQARKMINKAVEFSYGNIDLTGKLTIQLNNESDI